ncbi:uncharacterized protein TNCV_1883071 [Trichonephila clavipes]|nr:uncharacterized protein TNCV_1883071 [Trichonephila clavipes]
MACDAEDCGFQMLNDNEIVTSLQEESDPVDDETDEDEDNNESSKDPSKAGAFSTLETSMKWYEQQSEFCPTQLLLLKRVRNLAAKKRRCTMWCPTVQHYATTRKNSFSTKSDDFCYIEGMKLSSCFSPWEDPMRITLPGESRLITEKNTPPFLWCPQMMFSAP